MKKKLSAVIAIVTCCFSISVCGTSHAVLIERDFLSLGDGLLTYDTETRLEWLDLTVTAGMSLNYVLSQTGNSSHNLFRHFEVASAESFYDLVWRQGYNSTAVNSMGTYSSIGQIENFEILSSILHLFGNTTANYPYSVQNGLYPHYAMYGFTSGGIGSTSSSYIRLWTDPSESPYFNYFCDVGGDAWSINNDASDETIGTFLYRRTAPVPEPSTLILFGCGLARLAAVGRRKQK